jgi:hypothetical protein
MLILTCRFFSWRVETYFLKLSILFQHVDTKTKKESIAILICLDCRDFHAYKFKFYVQCQMTDAWWRHTILFFSFGFGIPGKGNR